MFDIIWIQRKLNNFKEVLHMITGWADEKENSTACGTACGAKNDEKKEENKPSSCGANK